ncbi:hypothetical protein [Peribacillus sp. SI8-4]|uniref:hypothetical protein n=1 Tax=Peribacillus sp. SI8-4 TaxID=3048009 RepID=UPI002555C173|nr:hypothetical protein [Peribacillus sp. SI8-4]
MITLLDLYYEDSKAKMGLMLKDKKNVEEIIRMDIQVSFEYEFSVVKSDIVWTKEDIDLLKEQIYAIPSESTVGTIALLEPDLTFTYIKNYEEENKKLSLYVTIDSGLVNSHMGTETGPTLKIITTEDNLIKWIDNVEYSFLGESN